VSITSHMAHFGSALLDFVYPPHCPTCQAWQAPDDRLPLCRACTQSLQTTSPHRCPRCSAPIDALAVKGKSCPNCDHWQKILFTEALVLTDFVGVAADAIHHLKFAGCKQIGSFLGHQMGANPDLAQKLGGLDLLVPVPLHAARQRERGFNQAEEIAKGVGDVLGIPLDTGCVRRILPTRQQARLHVTERAANMAGAFIAPRAPRGTPSSIGLMDDVLTTGATMSACAAALRTKSSARIIALAVASPFRQVGDTLR
jgi:ComF family protein